MARLPTSRDLGARDPQAGPGVNYGGAAASAAALGQDIQSAGNALASLGFTLFRKGEQERLKTEEFNARTGAMRLESEYEQAFEEAKNNIQPGGEGFTANVVGDWDQRATAFIKSLPERLRPEYDQKLFAKRIEAFGEATKIERAETRRYQGNILNEALDSQLDRAYRNPEIFEKFWAEGDAAIDSAPHLTPIERDEAKRAWRERAETSALEAMVETDPTNALRVLGGAKPIEPQRQNPEDDKDELREGNAEGLAPDDDMAGGGFSPVAEATKPAGPIIRMVNQGATRRLPITSTLASRIEEAVTTVYGPGYTVQVYSGGQPAKGTPNAKRVGSTRHDDGRAADVYIVGPDGKRLTGDKLAPIGQYWLAMGYGGVGMEMRGGGVHLDEHTDRARVWNYAKRGGSWTPAMQAATDAGLRGILPNGKIVSGEDPRFGSVEATNRQRLRLRAESRLERQSRELAEISNREEFEVGSLIASDIASIRATGQGVDGLSTDLVAQVFGERRAMEYEQNRRIALGIYQGTSDLASLDGDQLEARLDEVRPVAGSANFVAQEEIYRTVKKAVDAQRALRMKDPAAAVEETSLVKSALEQRDPNNPQSEQGVVRARLAAQENVGILPEARQPLTNDEAERIAKGMMTELLDKVSGGSAFGNEGGRRLFAEKYREMQDIYGEFADEVMRQVVESKVSDRAYASAAAAIISDLARGNGVTAAAARRYDEAKEDAAANTAMDVTGERTGGWFGSLFRSSPMGDAASRAAGAAAGALAGSIAGSADTPASEMIRRRRMLSHPERGKYFADALTTLSGNPGNYAAPFDQMFGPGASAFVIQNNPTPLEFEQYLRQQMTEGGR